METKFAIVNSIRSDEIRSFRERHKLSRRELAFLAGVSIKTIENWETTNKDITGPIVLLLTILDNRSELIDRYRLPEQELPIRMYYMSGFLINTVVDVDLIHRKIQYKNYTDNLLLRAFGSKEEADYYDYEKFLESRCFPRTRDKMKIQLEMLGLKSYDPLAIVRKTKGRLFEDDSYIEMEQNYDSEFKKTSRLP